VAPSPSDLGAVVELDSWGGAPERRTAAVAERGDERVGGGGEVAATPPRS
jgi:hypothetical protein